MTKSMVGQACALRLLAALCVLGAAQVASAVTVDFENPPYAIGNVVGQDSWAFTGYTGTPNGTVAVSGVSPLATGASQSLSYTRTELGLAGTFADVVKTDVATIAKDGTPAPDLNAKYLISSTSLATQGLGFGVNGLVLSHAGPSGASPLGMRLNNAGSTLPSIEVFGNGAGGVGYYYFGGSAAAAAFPENDTLEFNIDVDFDTSMFTIAYRNVTTGGPVIASGSPFGFAVPYAAKPNGTYDVDVIATFRYGAGKIDNISLTGNLVPEPATASLGILGLVAVGLSRRHRRVSG